MPTGNLPAEGKKLWEEVYDKALKGSCKNNSDPKGCAAGSAWKAVKNAGWKKDASGNWHKSSLTEFSLRIERAIYDKATNERRWKAVASDTEEDSREDNMSLELFEDFIQRIESGEKVPEQFRSEFWSGGMPYVSVSHYPDLGGEAVPGVVDATYVDGNYLKAKGKFHDTPLGRKCFEAICSDLYGTSKSEFQDKVRISIAFLDWKHQHKSNGFIFERKEISDFCPECLKEIFSGEGEGKIFLRGHLVHYAMTRVPVNKRTDMEVDKSMADIKTRKEDAASIVGDELAEELEEKANELVGKSEALVIKADNAVQSGDDSDVPVVETASESEVEKFDGAIPVAVVAPIPEEKPFLPYGGATSLKDALALQDAKEAMWDVSNLWYMTQDIRDNIMATDEITDKATAISDLLDEFKSKIKSLSEADIEKAQKTEQGKKYPSSDYLVVEDPDKPSTWHLQVKRNGKPDHGLMGAAKAALTSPGGHRGNKYEGPDKAKAIAKLKRLYASEKMEWTSEVEESEAELPVVQTMSKADFDNIISIIKSTISESIQLVVKPVEPNPHPLDIPVTTFKAAFDGLESIIDEQEKLHAIQEPFNQLGREIVEVIKASVKKPEPTTPVPSGDMVSVLSQAIAEAMKPFAQKLDLVSAQLQSKGDERVPQRRSIPPSPVPPISSSVNKSETPKLRAVIERTTL